MNNEQFAEKLNLILCKGSGMYAEASGSTSRRGEIKRKCNRCGKTYYYTTSYEKHMQTCMGPSTFFSDEGDDDVAILPDGDDSADYQLYNCKNSH